MINKIIKETVLSLKIYRCNYRSHLLSAVSVSVGLFLFLIVGLWFDFSYATQERNQKKIQDNYISVSTFYEQNDIAIRNALLPYSCIENCIAGYIGHIVSKDGISVDVCYSMILSDEFPDGYSLYSGITSESDNGYEKFELICGTGEFTNKYDVIISEEMASFWGDNPNEAVGEKIYMTSAGFDTPYTVIGVYKNIGIETQTNRNAYNSLKNDPEYETSLTLQFAIFGSSELKEEAQINSYQRYYFYKNKKEKEKIVYTLEKLKNETDMTDFSFSYTYDDKIEEELKNLYATYTLIKCIVVLFVAVFSGISIFGTMTNAVLQRKKEIGIKRALGASDGDILFGFLVENIINSLIAIVLSISLASIVYIGYYIYQHKIVCVDYIIRVYPSTVMLFICFAFSAVIGFGLIPAYYASQVNILDVMKDE